MIRGLKILLLFIVAGGVISCDKDSAPSVNYDRGPLLINFADNLIIPSYSELLTKVELLKTEVEGFIANTDAAHLNEVRAKWSDAYLAYQKTGFYYFGPAEDALFNVSLNTYPTSKSKIEGYVSSGTYDLNAVSNNDAKGFPALDYLLYGISNEDQILGYYTDDASAENRKQYLLDVVNDIITKTTQVKDGWTNYRETFISRTGNDASSSIKLLVEGMVQYLERDIRDNKIGIPLGIRSLDVPIPNNVEALYATKSIILAVESVKALQNIYFGKGQSEGEGFDDYLQAINARYNGGSLHDAIAAQLSLTVDKVAAIPEPYAETVENNQVPAAAAYQELQKLTLLMKTDLPSEIGVTITYQDNDGD